MCENTHFSSGFFQVILRIKISFIRTELLLLPTGFFTDAESEHRKSGSQDWGSSSSSRDAMKPSWKGHGYGALAALATPEETRMPRTPGGVRGILNCSRVTPIRDG
jgi:hypothetical protein